MQTVWKVMLHKHVSGVLPIIGKITERKCNLRLSFKADIDFAIVLTTTTNIICDPHWNGIQVSFGSSFYMHI